MTLLLIDSARSGLSLPIHSVASSTPASASISPSLAGKGTIFNIMVAGRAADAEEAGVKVEVELPAVDGDAEAEADNDGDDAVVPVPGLKRGVPGLDQNSSTHAPLGMSTRHVNAARRTSTWYHRTPPDEMSTVQQKASS